jgi:hypothetical protein
MKITGMSRVLSIAFNRRQVSNPSNPGIITSSRICAPQRFLAVARDRYPQILAFEAFDHKPQIGRGVVDHQNSRRTRVERFRCTH